MQLNFTEHWQYHLEHIVKLHTQKNEKGKYINQVRFGRNDEQQRQPENMTKQKFWIFGNHLKLCDRSKLEKNNFLSY